MKLLEKGQYGGQCGKYANVVFDNYAKGKWFGDTIEQKRTFINSLQPVPGAMVIVNTGKYGHIAIVKDVYEDGTILINDSNSKHTELVNEYELNPEDPKRPRGGTEKIEGFYIPYSHFFNVAVDREGNAVIYNDVVPGEAPMIGLIGNHGKEPTQAQLDRVRELVITLDLPAYEKQTGYCTRNFNTGMLKKAEPKPQQVRATEAKQGGAISERMYFSYYNVGDVSQNDSSPCRGAGSNVVGDLCKLSAQGVKHMALVRPKRDQYDAQFGDTVVLKGDKTCSGSYIVADEMNKRFRYADNVCTKNDRSPYCIRGDLAFPNGVRGAGGNCYISEIIRR